MKTKSYAILSGIIFIVGVLFFAFYHEYLIINLKKPIKTQLTAAPTAQQKVMMHFWKEKWKFDEIQLLLNQNPCHDAQLILANWIELALDEHILTKKITVQPAMITQDNQHLYISFDLNPFGKESATFEKWMIIEGILKTIHGALPSIKRVTFLLDHQPLTDAQLDFSNPWPIEGFAY